MAPSPITSCQIDGETVEIVTDFIFLGLKITPDGDCSHEVKIHLLLVRKAMTNPESILKKQRHYFTNKGPRSQSYGFSINHVWMWGLDWVSEKFAFELWCLRRLLSPLDFKNINLVNLKRNQPWIFIGRTEAEAEALILWPPDVKSQLIRKDLMLEKIEGRRRKGWQRMKGLDGITDSMDMSLSKLREMVKNREA